MEPTVEQITSAIEEDYNVYEGSISKNKEMPPKLFHKLALAAIKALKVK